MLFLRSAHQTWGSPYIRFEGVNCSALFFDRVLQAPQPSVNAGPKFIFLLLHFLAGKNFDSFQVTHPRIGYERDNGPHENPESEPNIPPSVGVSAGIGNSRHKNTRNPQEDNAAAVNGPILPIKPKSTGAGGFGYGFFYGLVAGFFFGILLYHLLIIHCDLLSR